MCIDVAWNYSTMDAPRSAASASGGGQGKRFAGYALYAWGSPALLVGLTALAEWAPGLPDHRLRPYLGALDDCWFHSKMTALVYHYIPVSLLVVCNLVLAIITGSSIVRVQRQTAVLKSESVQIHGQRAQTKRNWSLTLCWRIIFLTALTYFVELVTWATTNEFTILVFILDTVGRNIFIFILFCWKPKELKDRWQQLRQRLRPSCQVLETCRMRLRTQHTA